METGTRDKSSFLKAEAELHSKTKRGTRNAARRHGRGSSATYLQEERGKESLGNSPCSKAQRAAGCTAVTQPARGATSPGWPGSQRSPRDVPGQVGSLPQHRRVELHKAPAGLAHTRAGIAAALPAQMLPCRALPTGTKLCSTRGLCAPQPGCSQLESARKNAKFSRFLAN